MGTDVLGLARNVLDDPTSPYTEVRYAGLRLAECLTDALRVAESRGAGHRRHRGRRGGRSGRTQHGVTGDRDLGVAVHGPASAPGPVPAR
jgi:hypothetical protein